MSDEISGQTATFAKSGDIAYGVPSASGKVTANGPAKVFVNGKSL